MFLTKWECFPIFCFEGEFFYFKLKVEGESVFPVFVVKVKALFQDVL